MFGSGSALSSTFRSCAMHSEHDERAYRGDGLQSEREKETSVINSWLGFDGGAECSIVRMNGELFVVFFLINY